MTIVCGIDEAGRGPIIGPMVLCGVCVRTEDHLKFKEMGARDSKELTPKQRNALVRGIKELATAYKLVVVEPEEIDKTLRSKGTNLNWLEADKQAEILNELKPDVVYIDCPSPNIKAFTSYIRERVEKKMEIICAHHADRDYPSVSAASILAKVERDRLVEELKKQIGINFGSG
ncbi:MAG: ribonuclease HII, partial [Candidatus Woesearchaeota archaeon]|nr:ribonuclease HII [Candidatus Woesearchaeota archaeon]